MFWKNIETIACISEIQKKTSALGECVCLLRAPAKLTISAFVTDVIALSSTNRRGCCHCGASTLGLSYCFYMHKLFKGEQQSHISLKVTWQFAWQINISSAARWGLMVKQIANFIAHLLGKHACTMKNSLHYISIDLTGSLATSQTGWETFLNKIYTHWRHLFSWIRWVRMLCSK